MADEAIATQEASPRSQGTRRARLIFIILQCLDLLTTVLVFSRGGIELNPVLLSLMPSLGRLPAIMVGKAILVSVVLLFSRRSRVLAFANLFYTGVVAWNLIVFFGLK